MEILNFIKENHLIIIPVLFIIGMMIKNTNFVRNEFIPFILLPIGILSSFGLEGGFTIDSFFQGVLITGLTVYGNEAVKQINILRKEK